MQPRSGSMIEIVQKHSIITDKPRNTDSKNLCHFLAPTARILIPMATIHPPKCSSGGKNLFGILQKCDFLGALLSYKGQYQKILLC